MHPRYALEANCFFATFIVTPLCSNCQTRSDLNNFASTLYLSQRDFSSTRQRHGRSKLDQCRTNHVADVANATASEGPPEVEKIFSARQ